MSLSPLIVRKDHVACTVCGCIEPIHPGDGTPIDTFILALEIAKMRHPAFSHPNPYAPYVIANSRKSKSNDRLR